jgi:hypothetical protein
MPARYFEDFPPGYGKVAPRVAMAPDTPGSA